MKTESKETSEKRIETLEEATDAVLNKDNSVYDEINLAMSKVAESRHALYEAQQTLKNVVQKYGVDDRVFVDKVNEIIEKITDSFSRHPSDGRTPKTFDELGFFEGLIQRIRMCCKSGPISPYEGTVSPPSEQ